MRASKYLSRSWIETILKHGHPQSSIKVIELAFFSVDNSASILVRLTSHSSSKFLGHFGMKVFYEQDGKRLEKDMVLKVKPHGSEISNMLMGLASHCGDPLASTYEKYLHETGFDNTHGREITIYRKFKGDLLPEIYGTYLDEKEDLYFILMEYLGHADLLNSSMEPEKWDDHLIKMSLDAMAKWHAAHLVSQPSDQKYWSDTSYDNYMLDKCDLWTALLNNARTNFPEIYTDQLFNHLNTAINHLEAYQNELTQLPNTLVHNDANPRNACIRSGQFCLYDWELATFHVPQYDIVEWLCFVLDENRYKDREYYLGYYQNQLNKYSGHKFPDKEFFRRGFYLAALDFGLHRLGMYMMAHTVSPYPFLPRVVASYADTVNDFSL